MSNLHMCQMQLTVCIKVNGNSGSLNFYCICNFEILNFTNKRIIILNYICFYDLDDDTEGYYDYIGTSLNTTGIKELPEPPETPGEYCNEQDCKVSMVVQWSDYS